MSNGEECRDPQRLYARHQTESEKLLCGEDIVRR